MTDQPGTRAEIAVSVYEEPDHRPCLTNEWVHAYRVVLPAGKSTLWHRHEHNTIYLSLRSATGRQDFVAADPIVSDVPCGLAIPRQHGEDPLTHRVSNVGTSLFFMVGIEFHSRLGITRTAPVKGRGWDVILETSACRVYRLRDAIGPREFDRFGMKVAKDAAPFGDSSDLVQWMEPGTPAPAYFPDGFFVELI